MAMHVDNNRIYILVAETDAIKDNRITFSSNAKNETTNYCPVERKGEDIEFYNCLGVGEEIGRKLIEYKRNSSNTVYKSEHQEEHSKLIIEASELIKNKPVYFNKAKLKEYYKKMTSKYKNKYAKLFKGEMSNFDAAYKKLDDAENNLLCDYLFLTGERPYLQFASSENWNEFKKMLYAEASTIVIECFEDCFIVFPEAHALLLDVDDVDWDKNKTIHHEQDENKIENCNNIPVFNRRDFDNPNDLSVILYGAPGTGKTYSMPEYAVAIIEKTSVDSIKAKYGGRRNELLDSYNRYLKDERIIFTTFHQNYGYEDFIQGLRPDFDCDDLKFKVFDGVFKQLADKALHDEESNYVIIIDEINRGNISKIFGELITLIEEDKRWGETEQTFVKLPSQDIFTVPNNLYILGTMNSADKSISLVDAALRRRFNFIEMEPNGSLISEEYRTFFEQINDHLRKELQTKDLLIGHSYFINKPVESFDKIINKNIIPLLYEYFFDDEKRVKKALEAVAAVHYIDKNDNTEYVFEIIDNDFGRIKCVKKKAAIVDNA